MFWFSVGEQCYFFFKHLIGFTREAIRSWVFLYGIFFFFNLFTCYRPFSRHFHKRAILWFNSTHFSFYIFVFLLHVFYACIPSPTLNKEESLGTFSSTGTSSLWFTCGGFFLRFVVCFWILVLGLSGGPVAKTLRSQCRGLRFDPWSENEIPHASTKAPLC